MDRLKFAVIHSLEKEKNSVAATVRTAPNPLDVANTEVLSLARQLSNLVGRDGSTVYWGQFGANNREGQFPNAVQALVADVSLDVFVQASNVAMLELLQAAQQELLATGGYVCFIVYEVAGVDFFLVAMIKERDAITLSEALVPTEVKHIDLSKLHQAARINLARYQEFFAPLADDVAPGLGEGDAEGVDRTYLCFVNKDARTEVAKYFVEALGCEKGISSVRSTRDAVAYVRKYFQDIPETKNEAIRIRRAVVDHLFTLQDGANVTIPMIVNVARVSLGDELSAYADGLTAYLNSEVAHVPESFNVSHKTLQSMRKIVARGDGWQMTFDDGLLGEAAGASIIYDRRSRSITITNPNAEAVLRIEAALSQRRLG